MPVLVRAAPLLLAASLLCTARGSAQDLPELVAPEPVSSTDVPYPAGAAGEATVVLELVVERDGSVSSADVVEGSAPFAEQARGAVLGWRFLPARRGEVTVAAKIRAKVVFRRDEAGAPSTSAPQRRAQATAPKVESSATLAGPAPEPPVDITVSGVRREVGQTTLSAREVRELPGAFGDAFRAIEALPGVTALASGIPYFYVRGAPPNNAGYTVDGIRIPMLFHLGIGQAVLHQALIDRVEFFPSAAPARFGGAAGGIIAGETRAPADAFHGEAGLRLVDAGALVEAPFAAGRGTALVAGRYGFPGPILSAVSPDLALGYWDYQARTTFRVGPRDTLGLFGFGSHDYLATRSPSGDPVAAAEMHEQFVSDFHRLDLRYDRATDGGGWRVALTGGYDSQGSRPTYVTNRSAALRVELDQRLSDAVRMRAGAGGRLEHYRLRITARGPGEPEVPGGADPPPTNLNANAHVDFVLRLASQVELVPGVRAEWFASSRKSEPPATGRTTIQVPAVAPRLAARIGLLPGLAWLANLGLAHQYPSLRVGDVPAAMLSVPGFPSGVERLQTATQASSGFELALPAEIVVTATGFFTHFSGLTDLSVSCFQDERGEWGPAPEPGAARQVPPYVCPNNRPVSGRAYGLEVLVRTPPSKRLSGSLSYTLSRSTRHARFTSPSGEETLATVPSEFDRTHVLNAAMGYDLGRRWRAGGRFLFYTGTPYSALDGSWPVPPFNAYRNPAFYRVDVRLEKRWRLGEKGSIAFVLEGQNVTLSKEVTALGLDCRAEGTPQGGTTSCQQSEIGPVTIPSVGVEVFF